MKTRLLLIAVLLPALLAACSPSQLATPPAVASPTPAPTPVPTVAAEPGTILWTFSTEGEIWSSPTVQEGVAYIGSDDHSLYAVDVRTQQLKWKFTTADIVRSRPAVAEGTVYFTSDDGYLFAVDAATGQQVWKFDMGRPLMVRKPIQQNWDYMQASPVVSDGVVFSGTSNQIFHALDAKTGQEKWSAQIGLYVRDTPAVADGIVYVGDWLGTLHAFDARTGETKWTFSTYGPVIPSPVIANGVVYIGSKFPCLYAIDAATGSQKWCFSYGNSWVESTAVVVDGMVYAGSSDLRKVNAVDIATGTLKWDFETEGDPWSSPAYSNGFIYIGATKGYLYALEAASGAKVWEVKTGRALKTADQEPVRFDGGVVSSPTVVDGVVYFGSLDGKLYAVSAN